MSNLPYKRKRVVKNISSDESDSASEYSPSESDIDVKKVKSLSDDEYTNYFHGETSDLSSDSSDSSDSSLDESLDEAETRAKINNCIARLFGQGSDTLKPPCDDVQKDLLEKIKTNIASRAPTMAKLLDSNLPLSHKETLYEHYKILENTQNNTYGKLLLSGKFLEYLNNTDEQIDNIDERLEEYRTKIKNRLPTINKILSAKICESDRLQVIELYDSLLIEEYKSPQWAITVKSINKILESQYETQEELDKFEEEEAKLKDIKVDYQIDLKNKILNLDADIKTKAIIYNIYNEMIACKKTSPRWTDLEEKVIWAIKLPHKKRIENIVNGGNIRLFCETIYKKLDENIYGMKEQKQRIIQVINDRFYNSNSKTLFALKGKPGTGKTKLVYEIARALNLPFDKINLGGSIDSTLFKGSNTVWSGAGPSMILQLLAKLKCCNPIILLDEIDKLGHHEKGLQVQYALLHILDPTQNAEFQDEFLCDYQHDLSNIWFIPTMNDDSKLDPTLKDRLDIIEVPTYSKRDMIAIISKHTLPSVLKNKGISPNDIRINEKGVKAILEHLSEEIQSAGMRPVEKIINLLVSRLNLLRSIYDDQSESFAFDLSYRLPDFKGFPIVVTEKDIKYLLPNKKSEHSFIYT